MKVSLASEAELYAEHRRTASPRKRAKIAAELQRRHDERNGGPIIWRTWEAPVLLDDAGNVIRILHTEGRWRPVTRYNFALWLP
jgi:hypothetical protein